MLFRFSLLAIIALSSIVTSCSTAPRSVGATASNVASSEDSSDLTLTEAEARKSRLSNVTYELNVDVAGALVKSVEAEFSGAVIIRFELKDNSKNLRVDFSEGAIKSLVVNGKPQDLLAKKKYWIELPAASLVQGANEVRIQYTHAFSRSGEGLHRFQDPTDGKVYLYTQFETYDANRFVPCFDQPDLRAELNMTVTAPKAWIVVSGAMEKSKNPKGENRVWVFGPTAKIATYLFSLHAGPYFVFNDKFKRGDNSTIPLRILVRSSLKNFLKHNDWFKTTKDGIAFYENYFDVRYPFGKLDQLVVPEFNSGGMENVAAITYTENILPRSALTRKVRRGISSLLLHEIAHMWFGDLVTMAWWNNLWLNESFATYMSAVAQSEATEYKEVWQIFGGSVKARAYIEDAMLTTHPIEAPTNTVKEAMTNFDAITYNKGASVLRQLNYYMTSTDFRDGVRDYFKAYSFENTTLSQFIASLQKHTKKDLNLWADRWLRQSGTDTVTTSWQCEGGRLKQINVTLETLEGRKPRPQSVEVGLFRKVGTTTTLEKNIRTEFDGSLSRQTAAFKGDWTCPSFVYPNAGDHGYVLVKLDKTSLAFLTDSISTVEDVSTRALAWNDLWRMVRETELPLKNYVQIVSKNFTSEKDESLLRQILTTINGSYSSILNYWPLNSEKSKADRAKFVISMENEFLNRMKVSSTGSDDEKFWFDSFNSLAESAIGMEQLYKWYITGRVSKNFVLDIERAWGIAKTLSRYGYSKSDAVLSQMQKKDTTDRGLKNALSVDALSPKIEVKQKWIGELTGPDAAKKHSLEEAHSVLYSLFPVEQRTVRLKFSNDYFNYLEKNRKSEDYSRVGSVLATLEPLNCDAGPSAKLKEKLNAYGDINPSFKKHILQSLEEDERCQRIRSTSSL